MVWSRLFMDVDLVLLIFRALGGIKMIFPITRHVWNALLCIRYVESFNLGYPVGSKTIFLDNRLVQSLFSMAGDGMKLITHSCGACTANFKVLGVIKMNFSITQHVWSALVCIRFVKRCYLWYPVCIKTSFFRFSVGPPFIFHAFGLSKDYFYWLVMVWSRWFMDVDIVLLIFRALGVIKMNYPVTRHVWSALLCIRYVKSSNLGYPVCPKTIFLGIRLVRSSFFMRSVCQKTIFNGSWSYEVDYSWMLTLYWSLLEHWSLSKWIIQ